MNAEQSYLRNIICDHLNGENTVLEEVDQKKLYAISQQQQLSAIVYAQTRNAIFENAYLYQISYMVRVERDLQQLKKLLAGYEFFLVKGACLKEFYPRPELRSMGDIDLIIRPQNRKQTHRIMIEAGFVLESKWKEQWVYKKEDVTCEVHEKLVLSRENHPGHEAFSSRIWEHVQNNKLDWNYHFIYVLFHLRAHMLQKGVGFRQFMDVAILCKNNKELDWKIISEELNSLEALAFAKKVFAFNERFFGVKSPLNGTVMEDDFYNTVLEKLFKDGVFGKETPENQYRKISRIMYKDKTGARRAKMKYVLRMIFPTYEQLCDYAYLSYLKKSPFLFPVAWIHRLIYSLSKKEKREKLRKAMHSDNAVLQKQRDMLAKWGI
jgi:hypothetical protein